MVIKEGWVGLNSLHFSFWLAAAMAMGVALEPALAEKAEPAGHYEDARQRFGTHDYKGAIVQLKTALQKNPRNLSARILLGHAHLALGNSQAAIKELTLARKDGADDAFTLVPLAKAYSLLGDHKRILVEIRAGNRDPEIEADIGLVRGKAYLALNQLDRAQRALSEAARFRPDSAEPLVELARVQLKRNDAEAAEELVGAAFFRAPENAEVWFASGDVKRFRGDLEEALEDFSKAITLDPRHLWARTARAGTLIDLGRHEEAEPDVLYLRGIRPGNPRTIYFHMLILAQTDRLKEAQVALGEASKVLEGADPEVLKTTPPALLLAGVLAYYRQDHNSAYNHIARYVKLVPRNTDARRILGSLLLRRAEPTRAAEILQPAAELAPKDPQIAAMLGTALMRARRYSEAAEMFQRAATLAPESAALQASLGVTRLNAGEDEEATKALRTALALDASETQAAILLSITQLKRGEFEAALESARILIEQDPLNPFAHNLAGGAQLGLGNFSSARTSFEYALKADYGYKRARFNVAKLELHLGNVEVSEKHYRQILEDDAKSSRAMVALAQIAERRSNAEEAIRWLEKARFVDPTLVSEQIHLANLYLARDDPSSALRILRDLARDTPKNLLVTATLGRAELATGAREGALKTFGRLSIIAENLRAVDWLVRAAEYQTSIDDVDGADRTLNAAVRIDPKNLPAQVAMVEHEMRLGRFDVAQRSAERLRGDYPEAAVGITLLGDLEMHRGRFDKAADAYAVGLKRYRKSDLLIRLHRARRAAGRHGNTVELLEDWVVQQPTDDAVRRVLAAAYMETGRVAESLALHEALLKLSPDDPALLNNLALLYQKQSDPRALPTAESAYRLAQSHAGVIDTYGWILVQNGEAQKGLSLLRNARVREPKIGEIRYHIAVALHRLGRREDALRELEAVLTAGAEFESAVEARALWERLSSGG